MAITVTQANDAAMVSESSKAIALTGVAAGSKLVVLVSQTSTSSPIKTYTVTDDGARTFTLVIANDANTGRQAAIYYYDNHPGGSVTVTVAVDGGGNINGHVCVVEVSGSGALGGTDQVDNASGTNHYAAQTTGFNVSAGSIIFACFALNATADIPLVAGGTGYTVLLATDFVLHSYRITSSGLTNERPHAILDRARAGPAVCCEFIEYVSTGGPFPHYTRRLLNGGFV